VKAEFPLAKVADIGDMLQWMARRMKVSLSALVDAGGTRNGSLISFSTGSKRSNDLNVGPVLRVLKAVGYELVLRPKGGRDGVVLQAPGALPLYVVGGDTGPLEIQISELGDFAVAINTMATAKGVAVTGLMKLAGIYSTSLVSLASGRSPDKDIRFANLFKLIDGGGFEMIGRPVHATARAARMALTFAGRDQ
jgi:hypothetical protein